MSSYCYLLPFWHPVNCSAIGALTVVGHKQTSLMILAINHLSCVESLIRECYRIPWFELYILIFILSWQYFSKQFFQAEASHETTAWILFWIFFLLIPSSRSLLVHFPCWKSSSLMNLTNYSCVYIRTRVNLITFSPLHTQYLQVWQLS